MFARARGRGGRSGQGGRGGRRGPIMGPGQGSRGGQPRGFQRPSREVPETTVNSSSSNGPPNPPAQALSPNPFATQTPASGAPQALISSDEDLPTTLPNQDIEVIPINEVLHAFPFSAYLSPI